ncbi:MAG TPA: hypothetical protein VJA94_19520 [Candidatus Angelobacter sp.]
MSEYDLKQVKADLDVIRAAAGIGEAPVRRDVMGNLLIAAAGLITAVWGLLFHGIEQIWGLLAVLLPAGYLVSLRIRHRKASGGSPQVRREFTAAGWVLSLAVPFVGYALWAQWMGIPPMLVLATTVFFVGMLMLNGVIAKPRHIELAPWCLALMAGALGMPSAVLSPVSIIGFMITAGGLLSACVIGVQLRQGILDGLRG